MGGSNVALCRGTLWHASRADNDDGRAAPLMICTEADRLTQLLPMTLLHDVFVR